MISRALHFLTGVKFWKTPSRKLFAVNKQELRGKATFVQNTTANSQESTVITQSSSEQQQVVEELKSMKKSIEVDDGEFERHSFFGSGRANSEAKRRREHICRNKWRALHEVSWPEGFQYSQRPTLLRGAWNPKKLTLEPQRTEESRCNGRKPSKRTAWCTLPCRLLSPNPCASASIFPAGAREAGWHHINNYTQFLCAFTHILIHRP